MSNVLFLDVDGPLHPTSAIEGLEPGVGILKDAAERNLMRWVGILVNLLEEANADVSVVIHSDWRLKVDRNALRELLAPLARWLGGTTNVDIRERYDSILDLVDRASIDSYRIVDDDTGKFPRDCKELIAVDPNLGLSEESIQEEIRAWLRTI